MMRYPLEEVVLNKKQNSKVINKVIGKLYFESDNIHKFKINTDLANFPKLKIWMLVLYYHVRQRPRLASFTIAFMSMMLCCGLEWLCQILYIERPFCKYIGACVCGFAFSIMFGILIVKRFLDYISHKFHIN